MAEGASRHWLDAHRRQAHVRTGATPEDEVRPGDAEAARLAAQLADFAWAGLRQVHRI